MYRIFIAIAAALIVFIPNAQAAQTVEADNGSVYRITEIRPTGLGGVDVVIYPPGAPGDYIEPMAIRFDCQGHMGILPLGPPAYIPPHSVAGRIAEISCVGIGETTKKMRREFNISHGLPDPALGACGSPPQRACVPTQ